MIRVRLRKNIDEAAKWRGTGYDKEFTPDELKKLIDLYLLIQVRSAYD